MDASARTVLEIVAKAEAKGTPSLVDGTPGEARALYRRSAEVLDGPPAEVEGVEPLEVGGAAGPLPARLYRPRGGSGALPAAVFYHGGGWVIGDLDTHDVMCREIANRSGAAVLSVAYRLAPEHKFPAAAEDAVAALEWTAENAGGLGLDPTRLGVAGDSAGGNLAAVVCLRARDAGGPAIRFQALLYPATDLLRDTASHREFTDYFLTTESIRWFEGHYLHDAGDRADWRASPLRAGDLSGLAPAYVLTAGYDPLRDEGRAYAERLAAAGVAVTYRCFEGQIHGFLGLGGVVPEAGEALAEIGTALREGLA